MTDFYHQRSDGVNEWVPTRQCKRVPDGEMRQTCCARAVQPHHVKTPLVCVLRAEHDGFHRGVTDLNGPYEFWWEWNASA